MSNLIKVAIVTGANKGIGYAIVKDLAKKFDGLIYLTGTRIKEPVFFIEFNVFFYTYFAARNENLGLSAVKSLEDQGVKVKFHQLDIDNQESIDRFASYLKNQHEGIDILINNAAIAYKVLEIVYLFLSL